jgi:hypothetical protein
VVLEAAIPAAATLAIALGGVLYNTGRARARIDEQRRRVDEHADKIEQNVAATLRVERVVYRYARSTSQQHGRVCDLLAGMERRLSALEQGLKAISNGGYEQSLS